MDFQDLFSILAFVAFLAIRYFLGKKGEEKQKRKQTKDPKQKEKELEKEASGPSPFETFFEELEKEFSPDKPEKPEPQSILSEEEEEEYLSPSEDPEFIRKQKEMQHAAEEAYKKAKTDPVEQSIFKSELKRKKRKKEVPFDPATAYKYKELLDRKHFEV